MNDEQQLIIFEGDAGQVEVRLEGETVWLSLPQMAELFARDKSVISRHLKNIFATGELTREATVAKNATVQPEGCRKVIRQIEYYNLDAIISVGYRVNSTRATHFRQWATQVLREHLTQGYTLNRQRSEQNAIELEAALALVKKAAAGDTLITDQGRGLVDVIARYTHTFLWLQRYDEGLLAKPSGSPGGTLPSLFEARSGIARMKADLMARNEATLLFGNEREDNFVAILGNLDQTVFGEPAYSTVESKAAHLLYFIIKNHPFSDGKAHWLLYVRRFSGSQRPPAT
jgi:hypothetical protein